jgi:hypothetical protein
MQYRSRRIPTDYSVSLDIGGDVVRAQVLDLTHEGLRVTPGGAAEPGDDAALVIRGMRYSGKVVWKSGEELGLAMTRPLPPDVKGLLTRSRIGARRTSRFLMP